MRARDTIIVYSLFLLSGCTGLIYEVVWSRELIFVLGGTTYAITTVLVAFMSGLGLGSYVAGRISDHLQQPGRAYGFLEIAIGLYALAVPLLLQTAEPLYRMLYLSVADMPWLLTGARFLVSSIVLLVPTTCMGATLPMLVRYITREGQAFGRSVSLLYGINTFGAMLGTMAAGFWLIPTWGLTYATVIAASINLLIGITAVWAFRSSVQPGTEQATKTRKTPPSKKKTAITPELVVTGSLRWAVLIAFGLSGFAAMVYQIAWTRALVMCVGSSTYAFTCILAAFIFGLALGSLAVARWVDRWRQPVLIVGALQLAIALSAIVIVPIHGHVPLIVKDLVAHYRNSYSTLLAYQFALIIAITVVPTLLMGAIFPFGHTDHRHPRRRHGSDGGPSVCDQYDRDRLRLIPGRFRHDSQRCARRSKLDRGGRPAQRLGRCLAGVPFQAGWRIGNPASGGRRADRAHGPGHCRRRRPMESRTADQRALSGLRTNT